MATVTESTLGPRANGLSSPTGGKPGVALSNETDASPTPAGFHGIRRAATVDEGAYAARWRPAPGESNPPLSLEGNRRRSSTVSDYSLSEAKRNLHEDVINPGGAGLAKHENKWTLLPLIFALLPAIGGVLHKNGSAFITDLMLLGLAAVFLNWSVTQPWSWYYSAQEVRVREEAMVELALDNESDSLDEDTAESTPDKARDLDDVPEEPSTPQPKRPIPDHGDQARRALDELYIHEVLALFMCFTAPLLGACLLHYVRDLLSRPSEALISNYNLAIFVFAAEIAPLSHLIKLVQARTLHLQRIVHSNPYNEEIISVTQMQELARRFDELESRMSTVAETVTSAALTGGHPHTNGNGPDQRISVKQEAIIARNVRNSIQPELDALNRAVRRYEKKATVLASITESRLGTIDVRLNDAISLAAAATKMNTSHWSIFAKLGAATADRAAWLLMLPVHAAVGMCMLPLRSVTGLLGGGSSRKVSRSADEMMAGKKAREGFGRRVHGERFSSKPARRG